MGPHKQQDVGGVSFSYLESGDSEAPLVLCAHGFPDHAPTFERLMTDLATAGFRSVAPWMRGYAPSTLEGPFGLDRIAEDLAELARALSPERRVAIVGHDWGAAAASLAVARFPERFCRAVTLSVPHPAAFVANAPRARGQLKRSAYMLFFQLPFFAERAVAKNDFAYVDRLFRDWSPGFEPPAEYSAALKQCLAASMPRPIQYYRAALRPGPSMVRAMRHLRKTPITVPTLYLHGARDGCIGYNVARNQERFYKAEFRSELLSGVGHFLHLEDPDRVGARIIDWLKPIQQA